MTVKNSLFHKNKTIFDIGLLNPIPEDEEVQQPTADNMRDLNVLSEHSSSPTSIADSVNTKDFIHGSFVDIEMKDVLERQSSSSESTAVDKTFSSFVVIEAEKNETNNGFSDNKKSMDYNDNGEVRRVSTSSSSSSARAVSGGSRRSSVYFTAYNDSFEPDHSFFYDTAYTESDISGGFTPPQTPEIGREGEEICGGIELSEIIIDFPPSYYDNHINMSDEEPLEFSPSKDIYAVVDKRNPSTRTNKMSSPKLPMSNRLAYYHHPADEIIAMDGVDQSTQTHVSFSDNHERILQGRLLGHCYVSTDRTTRFAEEPVVEETITVVQSEHLQAGRGSKRSEKRASFYRQASLMASRNIKAAAEAVDVYRIPIIIVATLLLLTFIALIVMVIVFPLT